MLKRNLLAVVILSFCASSVFAQPTETVFVTFGQGANVSNASTVDIADGTTGSAFVYTRGDFFPFLAFDLDFSTTDNSVIRFTGAEVFNPSFNGSTRWTVPSFTGGTANDADGRLLGIAVGEIGIDPELSAIDPFYDSEADAFILARIDYDIVGVGDADISLAVGDNFFFFADPFIDVFFIPTGSGTLTVVGVPEPSGETLLVLGLVGFVARRRRA